MSYDYVMSGPSLLIESTDYDSAGFAVHCQTGKGCQSENIIAMALCNTLLHVIQCTWGVCSSELYFMRCTYIDFYLQLNNFDIYVMDVISQVLDYDISAQSATIFICVLCVKAKAYILSI